LRIFAARAMHRRWADPVPACVFRQKPAASRISALPALSEPDLTEHFRPFREKIPSLQDPEIAERKHLNELHPKQRIHYW
jgi:hypothetical protein